MGILETIYVKAKKSKKRIMLVGSEDERIKAASKIIQQKKLCEVFVGNNLENALGMLKDGKVDGVIGGSTTTTAELLKTTFKIIGAKHRVSGGMFMIINNKPYLFADCAVIPDPDEYEIVQIAVDSAKTFEILTGMKANVAMLSFSTKGSAQHESVEKMQRAAEIMKEEYKKINVDGELQFDAAIDPEIAKRKLAKSTVAGKANVFIFPDLNSANICYKAIRHFAKAHAIGPILQGLNKPVNDLSRGCSVQDIVDLAAVTALQARNQ